MSHRIWSVVAVGVLTALALAPAQAQRPGRFAFGGQQLTALNLPPFLAAKLNLTAEQKTKIDGIRTKMQEELRAAFQGGGGGPEAFQQLREKQEKASAEAEALLNADQKKSLTAWKAEHQNYAGLGASSMALLAVEGISAEQKTKLKALGEQTNAKRRELFESLRGGGGGGEVREKMQALEAESRAGVLAVLTDPQKKQFEDAVRQLPQPGFRRPRDM